MIAVVIPAPDYDDRADEWRALRGFARGAKAIGERGQITDALAPAASREFQEPESLSPDLERGEAISLR